MKTLPVEFIFAQALNEVAEITKDLIVRYPVNTEFNNRAIRADVLRRMRAAIELTSVEPRDGWPS